jgi:translation initiation factor 1
MAGSLARAPQGRAVLTGENFDSFVSSSAGQAGWSRGIASLEARARLADDDVMSGKPNARVVYSTETAGKCPVCGWPQRNCQCSSRRAVAAPIPARIVAKLRVEKKGRGGKTVTVVYGLPRNSEFLKELSQELKGACGTGGTATEEGVELQGDLRERVRDLLTKRNFIVKG